MIKPLGFDQLRAGDGYIHIHGHRGARGILPENTLDGFRFTFDVGVRVVELDILMTADDIPVITHNPRLLGNSTRDDNGAWLEGEGPLIRELTFAELQSFDVGGLKPGSEYAARFPEQALCHGERVPAFAALCELANEAPYNDVWLNVEIKSNPLQPEDAPAIPDFVQQVLQPIQQCQLQNRVILQSFDWRVLHESARQAPAIPRSYLCYAPDEGDPLEVNIYKGSPWMDGLSLAEHKGSLPSLVAAAGGQVWAPYYKDISVEDMDVAREYGLMVNPWTVNEIEDIDRMIELGVDGIITDYPGRVQRRLLDHGLGWQPDGKKLS